MTVDQVPHIESPRSRQPFNSTLLGIILGFLAACVAPAVGCGAFGVGFSMASTQTPDTGIGPAVGVIRVEGPILSGDGATDAFSGPIAASDTIISLLNRANDDPDVKAIVLRINSPGGGVVASDEIHHALQGIDKPIVISMGEVAASGGYYISAPADYIYATPYTITGSIGVISEVITAEELLDDLGVQVEVIKSAEAKDTGSPYRDMTEEERAQLQGLIDEMYAGFVRIVAEGRGMDEQSVLALADGRVFTGQQAVELGLVDEIGYFEDAVAKAAALGGIAGEPRIIEFEPEPGFIEALYGFQTSPPLVVSRTFLQDLLTPSYEYRYMTP